MFDLINVLGGVVTLLLMTLFGVRKIKSDAVARDDQAEELQDATRADDVRAAVNVAREATNEELEQMSDTDLDRRLHEARDRTR